ncbi:MAG: U32 family peptidase [Parcubacteria group bacterium]|jgi:putative protease
MINNKLKTIELLAPAGLSAKANKENKRGSQKEVGLRDKHKSVELLAPAGNLEKLKYALAYGADAVYAGVPDFSLRVRINNFTQDSLREAVAYVHKKKKKIYITLNIYAHNVHLEQIKEHLKFLKTLHIDGVIVADPGIIMLVKKYLPKVEIHLSTQANAINIEAVKFWAKMGVTRIVLAREVTLEEIREIKLAVPKMELEYFVHGAMCMSYSGRCILSKWMTGRSANLGDCTQPCRWKFSQTDKIYETTVQDDMHRFAVDLEEDQHGTYFFNSRDMNLSAHVQDLVDAGVDCLKIEGRAKSVYYVATVTRAYGKIVKALGKKNLPQVIREQQKELDGLVNRGYSKGFLLGSEPEHNFEGKMNAVDHQFVGQIEGKKTISGKIFNIVFMHNAMFLRDKMEAVAPKGTEKIRIKQILNHKLEKVTEAHGGHAKRFLVQFDTVLQEKTLLRRRIK